MRALIVEHGQTRQALAAGRALARAGWTVGVAAHRERALSASSRAVSRAHVVPEPQHGLDAFVSGVNEAIAERGYDVVFGGDDAQVLALSERRADIAAVVPHAPHEAVLRALDKLELGEAAGRAGLAAPRTVPVDGAWPDDAPVPAVVKARLHAAFEEGEGADRIRTEIAPTREAAERRADEIRAAGGRPVLQEVVAGRLIAFVALVDPDGRVLARVQQEAERLWPPGAGVSTRAVTVPIDGSLAERVDALLADLGWTGLAELQFLVPDGGEPHLIDLNGRFYGSLALAVASGPNLPDLWARAATGLPVPAGAEGAPGVRYQWLEGDLKRALAERRGGLVRDLADTARRAPGAQHSIWALRDPGPALYVGRVLARRAARRMLPFTRGAAAA